MYTVKVIYFWSDELKLFRLLCALKTSISTGVATDVASGINPCIQRHNIIIISSELCRLTAASVPTSYVIHTNYVSIIYP